MGEQTNDFQLGELKGQLQGQSIQLTSMASQMNRVESAFMESIKSTNDRLGKLETMNWKLVILVMGSGMVGGSVGSELLKFIVN